MPRYRRPRLQQLIIAVFAVVGIILLIGIFIGHDTTIY